MLHLVLRTWRLQMPERPFQRLALLVIKVQVFTFRLRFLDSLVEMFRTTLQRLNMMPLFRIQHTPPLSALEPLVDCHAVNASSESTACDADPT